MPYVEVVIPVGAAPAHDITPTMTFSGGFNLHTNAPNAIVGADPWADSSDASYVEYVDNGSSTNKYSFARAMIDAIADPLDGLVYIHTLVKTPKSSEDNTLIGSVVAGPYDSTKASITWFTPADSAMGATADSPSFRTVPAGWKASGIDTRFGTAQSSIDAAHGWLAAGNAALGVACARSTAGGATGTRLVYEAYLVLGYESFDPIVMTYDDFEFSNTISE